MLKVKVRSIYSTFKNNQSAKVLKNQLRLNKTLNGIKTVTVTNL